MFKENVSSESSDIANIVDVARRTINLQQDLTAKIGASRAIQVIGEADDDFSKEHFDDYVRLLNAGKAQNYFVAKYLHVEKQIRGEYKLNPVELKQDELVHRS